MREAMDLRMNQRDGHGPEKWSKTREMVMNKMDSHRAYHRVREARVVWPNPLDPIFTAPPSPEYPTPPDAREYISSRNAGAGEEGLVSSTKTLSSGQDQVTMKKHTSNKSSSFMRPTICSRSSCPFAALLRPFPVLRPLVAHTQTSRKFSCRSPMPRWECRCREQRCRRSGQRGWWSCCPCQQRCRCARWQCRRGCTRRGCRPPAS
jgi:hypothetical protein